MTDHSETSLKGHILIAMPGLEDSRFKRSVIYICEHSAKGTMGLVINRPMENMSFVDVLQQVSLLDEEDTTLLPSAANAISIHRGGPVETGRGFVLHSADYHIDQSTFKVDDDVSLTETLEILKAMARGEGPKKTFMALGYSGWSGGQLEAEIQENSWLHTPASPDLIFDTDYTKKYDAALAALGIDEAFLSSSSGHA